MSGFRNCFLLLAVAAINLAKCGHGMATSSSFQEQCDSLSTKLHLPDSTVWFVEYVPANTNVSLPDNDVSCAQTSQFVTVSFCRVALSVQTAGNSSISMEAWLPSNYTGRFLSTGDGGLAGCTKYSDVAYGVEMGFATVGANGGHNGTSGKPFLDNPGSVEDLSWRSLHTSTVLGKTISSIFYGEQQRYSYYLGCSTGGRQGFKAAQEFPDDFDGLVIGAPALDFNGLASWGGALYRLTGPPGSPTFLTADQWNTVHQAILDQCDGLDGYVDGIIEDTMLCNPRPESLICPPGVPVSATCITGAQANTVRGVYSGVYGVNGSLVFPRMNPGSEITGAAAVYYSGKPLQYTVDWYRYAIYGNPEWDATGITPQDYAYAEAKDPFDISTWNGNLSAVRTRGSKILHYHGQYDAVITSDNSVRYYDHVARTMGMRSEDLDDFYRFFRISGMGHCSGGPGATFIGNSRATNVTLDPEANVLTAILRWVEHGKAPDTIRGTAFVNGTRGSEVAFERNHCRYPLRNVYSGSGDPLLPNSWHCVKAF